MHRLLRGMHALCVFFFTTQMARSYETEGFMFKDGDFSEEELSKYMDMDMGMDMGVDLDADLPDGGIDLSDPAVRSAFGLE